MWYRQFIQCHKIDSSCVSLLIEFHGDLYVYTCVFSKLKRDFAFSFHRAQKACLVSLTFAQRARRSESRSKCDTTPTILDIENSSSKKNGCRKTRKIDLGFQWHRPWSTRNIDGLLLCHDFLYRILFASRKILHFLCWLFSHFYSVQNLCADWNQYFFFFNLNPDKTNINKKKFFYFIRNTSKNAGWNVEFLYAYEKTIK